MSKTLGEFEDWHDASEYLFYIEKATKELVDLTNAVADCQSESLKESMLNAMASNEAIILSCVRMLKGI